MILIKLLISILLENIEKQRLLFIVQFNGIV